MRRATLLLAACAALAGCGGKSREQKQADQQAAVAKRIGWHAVFAFPEQAIGQINLAGFGLAQPEASPYELKGHPKMLGGAGQADSVASVVVAGTTPTAIDSIRYRLTTTNPAEADAARAQFADLVAQLLNRFEINGRDQFVASIRNSRSAPAGAGDGQTSAQVMLDGAPARITTSAGELDVTFTRPADSVSPSKPQG